MESALNNTSRSSWLFSTRSAGAERGLWLAKVRHWWYKCAHWETWDWRIKYVFIAPAWCWFCLRARSPWFFTAANPTLTFGGFDGESKKEMYSQLPPGTYPKSIYISRSMSLADVEQSISLDGFELPFAVKPNVGKMGFMFRRITSLSDLRTYHAKVGCDYIVQELVTYPLEVSVFYYRFPGQRQGTITGFIRKEHLLVKGDGKSTLGQLMLKNPRARFRLEEMKEKHKDKLHHILEEGKDYCLSPALNLSRGGKLVSLEKEKDERLLKVFDDLSHYTGSFYYGRYDIKCSSIDDLKQGRNFTILEYNGSGAEPHHVYGNGYNLWQACSILVAHWQVLFRISQINHKNGVPYWDFKTGHQFLRRASQHLKRLKALDAQTPIT